jgi:hypothetical protein
MELETLRGFGSLLELFQLLVVECSEKPVYDGEAPATEVISYLRDRGFIDQTPIEQHGDIFFVRA